MFVVVSQQHYTSSPLEVSVVPHICSMLHVSYTLQCTKEHSVPDVCTAAGWMYIIISALSVIIPSDLWQCVLFLKCSD